MIIVVQGRLVGHCENELAVNVGKADDMMLHAGIGLPECGRGLVNKRIRLVPHTVHVAAEYLALDIA